MEIGVITNPKSRKNRNRPNRAAELQRILGNLGEVHETASVESIKPVLREFLRRRARYWVADGGDGALHWMVRLGMEVLQEDEFAGQDVELPLTMPTNGGTIDFVAHNAGIRGRAEQLLVGLRRALESGTRIDEVEVDTMVIDAVQASAAGDVPFRTYGFASAAGGVGQRFFTKYYGEDDPIPRSIFKIVGSTLASMPVALSPLRALPLLPAGLRSYAADMFRPTRAQVSMDGKVLPYQDYTAIHIASMSINLGGVFRFFTKADQPGLLHALVGAPTPMFLVRSLPKMHRGSDLSGKGVVDRACHDMTIEAVGPELLAPIIDGEVYEDLRRITYRVGPRVRIPKITAATATN